MLFASKKDNAFYDVLEAQAQAVHDAAKTFYAFTGDFSQLEKYLQKLEEIEHEADALTHSFANRVNTQFVTPLDKEDMHALTDRLDDITDSIEAAAARIGVYRLPGPRPDLETLLGLLVAITQETQVMVKLLRHGWNKTELPEVIAGIHAMETRSDKMFRKALEDLFEDDTVDTRLLIKWKEIYERIEKAVNRCEKLASFIESLMVKYS